MRFFPDMYIGRFRGVGPANSPFEVKFLYFDFIILTELISFSQPWLLSCFFKEYCDILGGMQFTTEYQTSKWMSSHFIRSE